MNTTALPTPSCPYCGAVSHQGTCPRVRKLEYHADGVTLKSVEFHRQIEVNSTSIYFTGQDNWALFPKESRDLMVVAGVKQYIESLNLYGSRLWNDPEVYPAMIEGILREAYKA